MAVRGIGVGFSVLNGRPPALLLALATTASDRALGATIGVAGTTFRRHSREGFEAPLFAANVISWTGL